MKKLSYTFLILLFTISLTGCGDSSTGPDNDPGQAPEIPDLSVVAQPDISFFEDNNPQGTKGKQILDDQFSNYSTARFKAIFGIFFTSFGQAYIGFLNPAYNESADFNDGQWEWEYSYSAEGQSMSTRFIAEEQGEGTHWAMFLSYSDGQGEGYDNYKVMEGSTTQDGAQGQWTFYVLNEDNNSEVPLATTEWLVTAETERTISTELYEDGAIDVTFDYGQNGVEHTMTFEESGSSDTDIVFWNTDTKMGYVIEDGSKKCWDENFMNITCS